MQHRLVRCATLAALALVAAGAARAGQGRRHRVGDRPGRVARHPEQQHDRRCARRRSRGKSVEYIVLDDASDTTTAVQNTKQAARREPGRRDHRHEHDARLARDDRRVRRRRDADDLARVVGAHHRAGRREEGVDVQDAADRRDDGRRDPRARGQQRREDARLRRLQRRARRGVLRRGRQGREGAQPAARRQRALRAEGHERRRAGAQARSPRSPTPSSSGASGTPAALPARRSSSTATRASIYFNHGVANNDFLRVGGKDVEGVFVPASPVIVAAQLPDNHPAKKRAMEYTRALRSRPTAPGSVAAFGSYAWDACLELPTRFPSRSRPRSRARRSSAARCAMRSRRPRGSRSRNGAVTMSKTDHLGLDAPRARDGAASRTASGCCSRDARSRRARSARSSPRSARRSGGRAAPSADVVEFRLIAASPDRYVYFAPQYLERTSPGARGVFLDTLPQGPAHGAQRDGRQRGAGDRRAVRRARDLDREQPAARRPGA